MKTVIYKQKTSKTKNAQRNMRQQFYQITIDILWCWLSAEGHGTYPSLWLICPVKLHRKEIIFCNWRQLLGRDESKYSLLHLSLGTPEACLCVGPVYAAMVSEFNCESVLLYLEYTMYLESSTPFWFSEYFHPLFCIAP